jgi:hypothetical protein
MRSQIHQATHWLLRQPRAHFSSAASPPAVRRDRQPRAASLTDENADALGDALRWVARRSLIFGGQRAAGQPQLARPLSRLLPSAGPHPVYLPVGGRRATVVGGPVGEISSRSFFGSSRFLTKIREENKNLGKTVTVTVTAARPALGGLQIP